MSKRRDVAWDHRRSRKNIHVGKVSVFFRGASWHIYYRKDGSRGMESRLIGFVARTKISASTYE